MGSGNPSAPATVLASVLPSVKVGLHRLGREALSPALLVAQWASTTAVTPPEKE